MQLIAVDATAAGWRSLCILFVVRSRSCGGHEMNRVLLSLIEAEYERYKALGEGTFRQLSADELVTDTAGANSSP